MSSLKIVSEIDKTKWNDFLESHSHASIFQSPVMYDAYLATKNLTPIIIIVENTKTGKYAGVMSGFIVRTFKLFPKSVSSMLVINGGPIFDNSKTLEFLLINYRKKYNNTVVYSEIRNFNDYTNYNDIFLNNGFKYIKWSNYIIDLTIGEKELFSKLSNSKKRQIKKSIKNGLEIQTSVTLEELRSFYRILSSYYKNIIKKPLPPWEFFKNLYNFLYPKGLLKIFIVKKNGECMGGIICPMSNNTKTLYEFYIYGKRDGNQTYPSVLATWAPIQWGANNGYKLFDFMGAGNPLKDYGVREFKAKFGGENICNGRYIKIHNKLIYNIGLKFFNLTNKNEQRKS